MYDEYGFDENWVHKLTKYNYNKRWFKPDRFNVYTRSLYDQDGFDMDGYNENWFRYDWVHRDTWTIYNKDWFDMNGYDKRWLDKYNNPPEKEFVIIYTQCHVCSGTWFVKMRGSHHQSWDKQSSFVMCTHCLGWGRIEKKRIEVHV